MGDSVSLSIETLVAETYFRLVGFESDTERKTFRLLQTVQGVGAKAALAILHVLTPSEVLDAIAAQDKSTIARAQGVGPKLAQRVVTELKGKTGGIVSAEHFRPAPDAPAAATPVDAPRRDAISALMNLGYDETAARAAIHALAKTEDETVSTLITSALKGLSAT